MFLLFWFCLVFKVIGIEESGFVEKTNLRVGRINLDFSITDVQWHPVDGNYINYINYNILIINQIFFSTNYIYHYSVGISLDITDGISYNVLLCDLSCVHTRPKLDYDHK